MRASTKYVLIENGNQIISSDDYEMIYEIFNEVMIEVIELFPNCKVYVLSTDKGIRLDDCVVYCPKTSDSELNYIHYQIKRNKGQSPRRKNNGNKR